MMMTNEEITPKVALRIFSKILFAKSKLLIPWNQEYLENDFTFLYESID